MDEVRKESCLIVDASLFQDAAFVIGELLQLISENEKSKKRNTAIKEVLTVLAAKRGGRQE